MIHDVPSLFVFVRFSNSAPRKNGVDFSSTITWNRHSDGLDSVPRKSSLSIMRIIGLSLQVILFASFGIPSASGGVLNTEDTSIPGAISDGKPSLPAPPPVLPDFKIKSTVVRELDVVEPPPMSGLPPVTGTIMETVHLVEDPKLPDPLPPPAPPDDSGAKVHMEDRSDQPRYLFLSATVYDHSRTLLRCQTSGNPGKEITAWSNLDFNCFSGFSTFSVKGNGGEIRSYEMMGMGIGNEDTEKRTALLVQHDRENEGPEIPPIPDGEPAYVIVGDNPDKESVEIVEDLHQLYRNEGQRMKEAYLARIKAEEERRAYLLANPPVPEDRTIHFWERDHPVGMSADTIKKEGGN